MKSRTECSLLLIIDPWSSMSNLVFSDELHNVVSIFFLDDYPWLFCYKCEDLKPRRTFSCQAGSTDFSASFSSTSVPKYTHISFESGFFINTVWSCLPLKKGGVESRFELLIIYTPTGYTTRIVAPLVKAKVEFGNMEFSFISQEDQEICRTL